MIEILTKWALPVLLAALLGFIVWRKQKEEERFQMAKDRLHAAFDPTLGRLAFARDYKSTHEAPDIDSQLDSALPMQTEAIESYRRFVPKDGQPEYDKAWDDYRGWAKKPSVLQDMLFKKTQIYYQGLMILLLKIHTICKRVESTQQ